MIRFEDILEKVRVYQPDGDMDLLRRAYVFSAREHRGQVRQSGEPYLVHPLEVANILADRKLDVICVACGLLHDVVEDTLTTIETLEEYFGKEVSDIINGLTKISKISYSSIEEHQAENFRKMLMAMVDDIRILLIKLADRLHNMRTLQHLQEEKRERIANETLEIYAPLAGRLGMGLVKAELEELCLRYLEPKTHALLTARVEAKRKWTEEFIADIKTILEGKLTENGIPAEVSGRLKRLYSIYQKMKRQGIELDQIYDFVALRVITDSVKNCYGSLGIIHNTWRPVPGRIKDFIAMPAPNGYRSLHTSVITESGIPFEIQIRTPEMHQVAEEGIAAHWRYKEGRPIEEEDIRNFAWIRSLIEWQSELNDPHEFLNSLKIDLYPEEVYCFTPKGEVKSFPRGATPVDFAYAIHSDVGHQCVGARVNGKMVPLRYRLKNGDIVEVMTSTGTSPQPRLVVAGRDIAGPQQNKGLSQHERKTTQHRDWAQSPGKGGSTRRTPPQIDYRIGGVPCPAERLRGQQAGRPLCRGRLWQDFDQASHIPFLAGKGDGSETVGQGEHRSSGPARSTQRREYQGQRGGRPARVSGQMLQSYPRRENIRLYHTRQRSLGPRGQVSQLTQFATRPRKENRSRVGSGC